MATPTDFPEKNDVLKCPPDTPDCRDLPIHRGKLDMRVGENLIVPCPVTISCWEFTPQEMADIAKTGRAYIISFSATHPPLIISGTTPFNKIGLLQ